MKELKVGKYENAVLDPLSHGDDMKYLRVTYEVLTSEETTISIFDPEYRQGEESSTPIPVEVEAELRTAAVKIVDQVECRFVDRELVPSNTDEWGNLRGNIEVLINWDGKDWYHTSWPVIVDWREEI